MRVIIAGYNIDSSLISALNDETATPEAISAAYARISRSPKSVDALRSEALKEISKARKSNQSIIFGMGHASVAEHAVFNIDLIGISRHLTEAVQRSRLASYTEKSQRYVTFNRDYIIPAELDGHPDLQAAYIMLCDRLFDEYKTSLKLLKDEIARAEPDLAQRDLEGRAKEDARYILPLATKTQMGMTINARSLETLLRRLSVRPEQEARELRDALLEKVRAITPSLVKYVDRDEFTGHISKDSIPPIAFTANLHPDPLASVNLESFTAAADNKVLAALLFEQGFADHGSTLTWLDSLPQSDILAMWNSLWKGIKPWHKLPRAFECAEAEFVLSMSECCWGQFKRHRSATILRCPTACGNPKLIIPPAIKAIGREGLWHALHDEVQSFTARIPEELAFLRPYLNLNASILSVYAKINLRELHHFTRLRSDSHAQWEIRCMSDQMAELVKPLAPLATRFLCGKSQFPAARLQV